MAPTLLHQTDTDTERALYVEPIGVGLTHQAIAEALAEPGFTVHAAKVHTRNMATAGYVKPYGRGRPDKKAAYLYRPDAVLALAVLHRASEVGIGNPAARAAIGKATQTWTKGEELLGIRSPGTFIMGLFAEGHRGFALDLSLFRPEGQTESTYAVRYRQETPEGTRGTNFPAQLSVGEIRSSWTCPLDPILAHLRRARGAVH